MMPPDGYVGMEGLPGAGGSVTNLQIYGGRFGIDARVTQPTSLLAGVILHNQTCHALVYAGLFGQQTLVGAGLNIRVPHDSRTHVAIWVPGKEIPAVPGCQLLPLNQLPGAAGPTHVRVTPTNTTSPLARPHKHNPCTLPPHSQVHQAILLATRPAASRVATGSPFATLRRRPWGGSVLSTL